MAARPRVLAVDDDRAMLDVLAAGLEREFDVATADCGAAALKQLDEQRFAVVLTDLRMPGVGGMDLCKTIRERHPGIPVILVTAFGSMQAAIEAVRAGVFDFVTKPFELATIRRVVRRAAQRSALGEPVRGGPPSEHSQLRAMTGELVVESPAMRAVFEMAERVAVTDVTCLLTGESGVGKEILARWIHARSARSSAPFMAVNCAAVPESLLESELFGHTKGAFTDARGSRTGLFVDAGEGTVFLDELGDLPWSTQPKLLRALQERTVRPVGQNTEVPFGARIIGATNKSLDDAVARGEFREDLYYRVNVFELRIPPLRQRPTDILPLARSFLSKLRCSEHDPVLTLREDAVQALLGYAWPGNVRELSNAIERGVALARGSEITLDDLPPRLRSSKPSSTPALAEVAVASGEAPSSGSLETLESLEREHVARVLESVGGNKSAAAEVLGIDRKTLYRKLALYGPVRARRP